MSTKSDYRHKKALPVFPEHLAVAFDLKQSADNASHSPADD